MIKTFWLCKVSFAGYKQLPKKNLKMKGLWRPRKYEKPKRNIEVGGP